jgi:hypothetical protein
MLFTFLTSKEGSITIEQLTGENVLAASQRWYRESTTDPGEPLEGMEAPTPVSTVERVWCLGGTDPKGKFFWTHIVETATGLSDSYAA